MKLRLCVAPYSAWFLGRPRVTRALARASSSWPAVLKNLTSVTIFITWIGGSPHLHRRERERHLSGRSTPPVHSLLEEGEPAQISVCEVHEAEGPAPRGRRKLGRRDDSHP